jgi:hypothetical protein
VVRKSFNIPADNGEAIMCFGDLVQMLKHEGFTNVTRDRLYHAIASGKVRRPQVDGSHRFVFSDSSVNELRAYLRNVPRGGPRRRKPLAAAA